ncbi:hypothetical protein AXG93_3893s1220 [Marchantia polymorpha subsp. ruderalis]|uniref:Uncharacterized protein n=1 Tax=Marchantia polymorpha subsp. ruderalis TaxID=1480154 RepID=A0A176WBD2_MARPO|nr:hypothetical protein AXG93_3893s1220 [Marchantia polymorpha subsp. ruderalis]
MSLVYGCTAVDFISGPQQMIDLMHRMSSSLPAVVDVTWLHSSQNGPVGLDPWGKFRWGRVIVCWLVAGANDRFVQKRPTGWEPPAAVPSREWDGVHSIVLFPSHAVKPQFL